MSTRAPAVAGIGLLAIDCADPPAVNQALALGATKADDVYVGTGWQVLRDPEANEFCLLKPEAPNE
jgi:hypothetical protein